MLDVYPTLNELCSLARRDDLDGESLVPLLRNPQAKRERPAVITWGKDNHAARGERYRYIRHPDGTQQLYDHEVDPNEWKNLAGDPQFADVTTSHRKWLPKPETKQDPDFKNRKANSETSR